MSEVAPFTLAPALVLATAIGYAVATIGMKSASSGYMSVGVALAVAGFVIAFLAEIVLMRRIELAVVYIVIVAAETLLVLVYAAWIGEGLNARQAFGAAMVFMGLIAVSA